MRGEMAKLTFEDYLKANPPKIGGKPCWVCGLPEDDLKELHRAKKGGHSITTLLGFLIAKGHDATRGRLEAHFQNGRHHERVSK